MEPITQLTMIDFFTLVAVSKGAFNGFKKIDD